MFKSSLKLIFRNWWRNKTFTLISILSLTVGISCTALLISFVSYENGIEKNNPNRDKLVWVMTEWANNPGMKTASVSKDIAGQLKQKYPEVEDVLQFQPPFMKSVEVNNQMFDAPIILNVSASFPEFFPFEMFYGSWDALNKPNSILLSEKQAKLFFGDENALGKQIRISEVFGKDKDYTVEGVVKNREQSAITFDALFCNPNALNAGATLLKVSEGTNLRQLEQKVKENNIAAKDEQYSFYNFDDAISSKYSRHSFWHSRKDSLLFIGLISAILVLVIAIFNYVNMSFSRVLQQVKSLHTQKLMGAKPKDVRWQIFIDTFLTVFISFVLAMLLMHDLLPVFNQVVAVDFSSKYFYSKDFFPLLILLVFVLTIIPAWIMSRKISRLSGSDYKMFFVTQKNHWIASMVVAQFIVAFVLIIGTLVVNKQVDLVKSNIEHYKNVIEIGSPFSRNSIVPFEARLKSIPGIQSYAFTNGGVVTVMKSENSFQKKSGETQKSEVQQISGSDGFIDVLQLKQIGGIAWESATEKYPNPVFVNKVFANVAETLPENLIGKLLSAYIDDHDSLAVIAGIVDDFYIGSMERNVTPVVIRHTDKTAHHSNIYIRTEKGETSNVVKALKQAWRQEYPDEFFMYGEPYDNVMSANNKIFEMARLLKMYSLISILLTCFGLFGITFYAVKQRTKEIGIRKINGAKTPQLLWLLMKPMFIWIAVGFVIAVPLAWWLIERWLQQFAYRVDVSVFSFALAFLAVSAITFATVGWHVWRTARSNPVKSLKSE
ncbi:MAG: ABC transporter permease [Bacteroidia bacterium]|nr:ABC transporter permease [Bacteroidia bacterium]